MADMVGFPHAQGAAILVSPPACPSPCPVVGSWVWCVIMRGADLHILGLVCPPPPHRLFVGCVKCHKSRLSRPSRGMMMTLRKIASETAEYPDGEPSDSLRIALTTGSS